MDKVFGRLEINGVGTTQDWTSYDEAQAEIAELVELITDASVALALSEKYEALYWKLCKARSKYPEKDK